MLYDAELPGRARTIAYFLALLVLWLVLTPYPGITHDGQGYALQALARLDPAVAAGDIFLRFQSQDDFSVFPLLQALAIGALDVDWGTALLTLVFQIAWYIGAWLLLRQLLAPRLALLGLGLLVVVPGYYGALRIFQFAEPFLTARLPAEAIALLGIASYLAGRRLLSGLALLVALLVHPLMAAPAILILAVMEVHKRWGARVAWAGIALMFMGAVIVSSFLQMGSSSHEASWLPLLRGRSPHLFTDLWTPIDWSSAAQVLATLVVVVACSEMSLTRRIALSAAAVGVTGLILASVASTWPQLGLLLQGQPWRWLWVCKFLAIGLLPVAVITLWTDTGLRRAAALILASSWLIVLPISARSALTMSVPGALAVLALGLVLTQRDRLSQQLQRSLQWGAWAIFAFVVIAALLTTSLVATMQFAYTADPGWLRALGNVLNMTAPSVAIVFTAWLLTMRGPDFAAWSLLALAAVATAAIVPLRAPTWIATPWSGAARAEFADWRQQIPPQSEVLWWDGLREVWFLLQRRSYLTDSQAGGIVFSTDLVDEIQRRANNLEPYLPARQWIAGTGPRGQEAMLTPQSLARICEDPQLGFVIAEEDLGSAAPSHAWLARKTRVFLYDCGDVRASPDLTH